MPDASNRSSGAVVALVAVVAGVAMAIVGALGLAFGWGSSEPATSASASNSESRTTSTSTSVSRGESPSAFLDAYVTAVRTGDATFITERYDPEVIKRYGASQCAASTTGLFDSSITARLVGVGGPQRWDYSSDGLTTPIDDVFVFDLEGTFQGEQGTRSYHFALVDGKYRVFVDCGTPVSAS